jgi:hypothetical protein
MIFVPVVDREQKPLMPTTPNRAAKWVKSGKATPFWKKGVWCIRLNVEPSSRSVQPIAVGVDPGSKKEAFTVKSEAHTYMNIQADAVTWVKRAVKDRKSRRMARRARKTPCRARRSNRLCNKVLLPPSTKARWQWKLRILNWIKKLYAVSCIIVEDIKAVSKKGKRAWNQSFSIIEHGKSWFYESVKKVSPLQIKSGYETKELRDSLMLKKSKSKLSNKFEAHCVDSWVLANWWVGGHTKVDNKNMVLLTPLRFHRRQLHRFQPSRGGLRSLYGGTNSLGFKRGSLVIHKRSGLVYIGGTHNNRITVCSLEGKRLTDKAVPSDLKFLAYNSWRFKTA